MVQTILAAANAKRLALLTDRKAVTAIEYALIAALIAVVIIGALTTLGGNITGTLGTVASEL
jgi:pilus assembly protein Flp/PilA